MSSVEEFTFTLRHAVALGDRGRRAKCILCPLSWISDSASLSAFSSLFPSAAYPSLTLLTYLSSLLLPQEQWIMVFRFTYMFRPFLPSASIVTVVDAADIVRHFGSASPIFLLNSCLFNKLTAPRVLPRFRIASIAVSVVQTFAEKRFPITRTTLRKLLRGWNASAEIGRVVPCTDVMTNLKPTEMYSTQSDILEGQTPESGLIAHYGAPLIWLHLYTSWGLKVWCIVKVHMYSVL